LKAILNLAEDIENYFKLGDIENYFKPGRKY